MPARTRLFGTDGIRGVANEYPITSEMALKIGRAAGAFFQKEDRPHTILIGKDTRQSGYMIEYALTAGLCSAGVNVLLVGPLPTPGVSYIMRSLRSDAAIMISASHNPFQDNGIKFFGRDGFKIDDAVEDEIERLLTSEELEKFAPTGNRIGVAKRIDDAVGRYIEFAKASFPKGMRLDGLRIVCDCANGAAYKVGPYTLRELGAEVIAVANQPDGGNVNMNCGSVHPEEMRATVIREKADLGIAFDGDGDRIVMSDEEGRLLDGNALLAILGAAMLEDDALPKNTLVTTIMANGGLERAIESRGGSVLHTNVGDRNVVETMRREALLLGGEASGHIVMLEHNTTGDALITALHLLAVMIRKDQPLSAVAAIYQRMPETHTIVPLDGKTSPSTEQLQSIAEESESEMDGHGRVVIRPSGTEPIIRIMVQHESIREAESVAQELADRLANL